jgi:hypothetical protein
MCLGGGLGSKYFQQVINSVNEGVKVEKRCKDDTMINQSSGRNLLAPLLFKNQCGVGWFVLLHLPINQSINLLV